MKPLYVIDHSNWMYKFHAVHGKHSFTNIGGINIDTSVLFGYIRSLKSLIFNDILIVVDGLPSKSLTVLPTYKGTREKLPDDSLSVSKLEIVQFLTQIGPLIGKNVQVVCSPMQETDQVVSSIVHQVTNNLPPRASFISMLNTKDVSTDPMLAKYNKDLNLSPLSLEGYDSVIIASTDADFAQLQRFPNVFIDVTTSGKGISSSRTADSISQMSPFSAPCYKAIFGDVSDNVPPIHEFDKKITLDALSLITTNSQLSTFTNRVINYKTTKPLDNVDLEDLATEINKYCLREFMRNYTITFLDFVSFPKVMSYPSYNIKKTIEKYSLRI